MKNIIYAAIFALILGIGGTVYYFMTKCEEPSELLISLTQLNCAVNLDVNAFRSDACSKLHGMPECEFIPEDIPVVREWLNDAVNKCATDYLKSKNKCVDKYLPIKD